ncbi:hypothetical protein BLA29_012881 [Euroglyphus maynei]|uniref:Uncharacterized protein n=1 Tax=Euroglyphus maynei TaxID=6958 RepID=A0A1Y3AVD2_EURMA|nr:hypothetical protein BLA29_012881 [Euroglyphus maynei]
MITISILLLITAATATAAIATASPESIDLIPKIIRRPTHIDHFLCRQLHNGIGIRSIAVTVSIFQFVCIKKINFSKINDVLPIKNLSGNVCRTYCRIMDRMGGKIFYTENISPNFVRCGPYQSRVS